MLANVIMDYLENQKNYGILPPKLIYFRINRQTYLQIKIEGNREPETNG